MSTERGSNTLARETRRNDALRIEVGNRALKALTNSARELPVLRLAEIHRQEREENRTRRGRTP